MNEHRVALDRRSERDIDDNERSTSDRLVPRTDANRPVLAYHVIITTYGFWLPNDPRGSWSDCVRSLDLYLAAGPATKVDTRRSVAGRPHDRRARLAAKEALKYPAVSFDGHQALCVAAGFANMVRKSHYVIHACSILPQHVHLVIARHRYKIETVVRLLKAGATHELIVAGRNPLADFPDKNGATASPWAERLWKVFLYTAADIRRAIQYVENNPIKEGKRLHHWHFVTPNDATKLDGA